MTMIVPLCRVPQHEREADALRRGFRVPLRESGQRLPRVACVLFLPADQPLLSTGGIDPQTTELLTLRRG
jgi:hypothetical protein